MFGWHILFGLWNSMWLHDKLFSTLAYHFACLVACMWLFPFCDDHQFIYVNRCEGYLRSTWKGWFRCIVYLDETSFYLDFFLGLWPMYHFDPLAHFHLLLNSWTYFCIGILLCIFPFRIFLDNYVEWRCTPDLSLLYYLCDISFN